MDDNAIPIKDFDQCYDQMWMIKAKVSLVDFSNTTNLENGENSRSVDVQMEDYSGKISIVTFDTHAVLLNELAMVDTEYYVSKIMIKMLELKNIDENLDLKGRQINSMDFDKKKVALEDKFLKG